MIDYICLSREVFYVVVSCKDNGCYLNSRPYTTAGVRISRISRVLSNKTMNDSFVSDKRVSQETKEIFLHFTSQYDRSIGSANRIRLFFH
jgi:hypothetical protein